MSETEEQIVDIFVCTDENIKDAVQTYINGNPDGLPNISEWDVSAVTDMTELFKREHTSPMPEIPMDLSKWKVGNVTKMKEMFMSRVKFNSDLSDWDVSKVTDMSGMFAHCHTFNSDLSEWKVGNVTDMKEMFTSCVQFNSDLSDWDVSNVTDMSSMFENCYDFNSDLSEWNVIKVETMEKMFEECHDFNSDISRWDVSNVTNFKSMFKRAYSFKQNLSQWEIKPEVMKKLLDADMFVATQMTFEDYPSSIKNVQNMRSQEEYRLFRDPAFTDMGEPIQPYQYMTETLSYFPDTPRPSAEKPKKTFNPFKWMMREKPKSSSAPAEERNIFKEIFTDYVPFITFLKGYLSQMSPNEYNAYYKNLKYSNFTEGAPEGYSFLDIPPEEIANTDRPFYKGLVYLYSIIPKFNPSKSTIGRKCSEYTYTIYLGRLLYYYNIYTALNSGKLTEGFNNTAGVLIHMHGSYRTTEDTPSLSDIAGGTLENVYICSKSPVGCVSKGHYERNTELRFKDHIIEEMYSNIEKYGSVPFDEILATKDERYLIRKDIIGYCRILDNTLSGAMQNNINPDPNVYINKRYEGSYTIDFTGFVIDIERYNENKDIKNIYQRLVASNIVLDRELHKNKLELDNKGHLKLVELTLTDIITYYSTVRGKTNLFIYDNSCGALADIDIMPVKEYYRLVSQKSPLKNIERNPEMSRLRDEISRRGTILSKKRILGGTKRRAKKRRGTRRALKTRKQKGRRQGLCKKGKATKRSGRKNN